MILAAGLTPAWQQVLVFDRLRLGDVNRARRAEWCASGKVLNVARASHTLGARALALTVVGGLAGDAIRDEFARDGLAARWMTVGAPTRICTTLIDTSGDVTELVENAGPVTAGEVEAFLAGCTEIAPQVTTAVLTGSLPAQTPGDLYARIMRLVPAPAILDVRGPELLAALPLRPLLVKPNRAELQQTCGRLLDSEAALHAAMRELLTLGAQWVLVTQGPGMVWLGSASGMYRFEPPVVERPVNPIGCGDCVAAGIAVKLEEGATVPDAVAFGLAAAVENTRELLPARPEREAVETGLREGHYAAIPTDLIT